MFLFAGGGEHQKPIIYEFVNYYIGGPLNEFQMAYTRPIWVWLFDKLGVNSTPEAVFGEYTPEDAVPWYTVMFVIACILSVVVISIFKGKLSEDDPGNGQLTLEAGFLAIKDLATRAIGEHAFKYFPVIATFAILILVSNLMGLFPMFWAPTAHINVTLALGIASFVYYNYVGISENGLVNHIAHFTGPRLPLVMTIFITPLIFSVEVLSNLVRPGTLGLRLFANMFADEQMAFQIAGLGAPFTQYLLPVLIMPLATFVAFVQTLVFTLLSIIYISEVTHAPHDDHHDEEHEAEGEVAVAAA